MQATMSRSLVHTPLVHPSATTRSPRGMVVRASAEDTSRRAAVGALFLGAASLLPLAAEAKVKNPAQDSIKKGGSSTAASMSAFGMEGIKKRGLKPGARRGLLDEAKAKAQKLASAAGVAK